MASRADVIAWQEYVTLELQRFADHTDGNGKIWRDTPTASRYVAARRAGSPEEYAFSRPWHVVRPHVTDEFRQWVEEYKATERVTLLQWVDRARAERAEVDFLDSAAHTLGRLEEIARLMSERDALIVEAVRRGASKVDAARASGLSRQQVHAIIARATDEFADAAADLAPVTPITSAPGAHTADEAAAGDVEWRQLASGEWVEVF